MKMKEALVCLTAEVARGRHEGGEGDEGGGEERQAMEGDWGSIRDAKGQEAGVERVGDGLGDLFQRVQSTKDRACAMRSTSIKAEDSAKEGVGCKDSEAAGGARVQMEAL